MAAVPAISGFVFPTSIVIELLQQRAEEAKRNEALGLGRLMEIEDYLQAFSIHHSELAQRMKALKKNLVGLMPLKAECRNEVFTDLRQPIPTIGQPYEWAIRPVGQVPSLLCKGKYFRFQVHLVPLQAATLPSDLTVPIEISVISSDTPSAPILENMAGYPILRGQFKSQLKYDPQEKTHKARFKVQITEVSSHFVNGWVRLVIQPEGKPLSEFASSVKPFVVENVVVRAKERTCMEFRERERRGEPQQRVKNILGSPTYGQSHLQTY